MIEEKSNSYNTEDEIKERGICSICGGIYTRRGNNAQPINNGTCCRFCNDIEVTPLRLEYIEQGKGWSECISKSSFDEYLKATTNAETITGEHIYCLRYLEMHFKMGIESIEGSFNSYLAEIEEIKANKQLTKKEQSYEIQEILEKINCVREEHLRFGLENPIEELKQRSKRMFADLLKKERIKCQTKKPIKQHQNLK